MVVSGNTTMLTAVCLIMLAALSPSSLRKGRPSLSETWKPELFSRIVLINCSFSQVKARSAKAPGIGIDKLFILRTKTVVHSSGFISLELAESLRAPDMEKM